MKTATQFCLCQLSEETSMMFPAMKTEMLSQAVYNFVVYIKRLLKNQVAVCKRDIIYNRILIIYLAKPV